MFIFPDVITEINVLCEGRNFLAVGKTVVSFTSMKVMTGEARQLDITTRELQ
jgi:hypothetical protein